MFKLYGILAEEIYRPTEAILNIDPIWKVKPKNDQIGNNKD